MNRNHQEFCTFITFFGEKKTWCCFISEPVDAGRLLLGMDTYDRYIFWVSLVNWKKGLWGVRVRVARFHYCSIYRSSTSAVRKSRRDSW